jgi:hypothetical protein
MVQWLIMTALAVYDAEALKDTSIQAETLKLNHPRAQAATKVSLSPATRLGLISIESNSHVLSFAHLHPKSPIHPQIFTSSSHTIETTNPNPIPITTPIKNPTHGNPTEIHLARPPTCRPPRLFPLQLRPFRPARSSTGHPHPPDPCSGRAQVTGRSHQGFSYCHPLRLWGWFQSR